MLQIGSTIYPIAIKYDSRLGDAFWNSSEQSYGEYLWMMMTSWAIICDVWYMPPMTRIVSCCFSLFISLFYSLYISPSLSPSLYLLLPLTYSLSLCLTLSFSLCLALSFSLCHTFSLFFIIIWDNIFLQKFPNELIVVKESKCAMKTK